MCIRATPPRPKCYNNNNNNNNNNINIIYTSNSRRGGRSGVVIYRIGGVSLPPRQQQQRAKATATTTTRAMMMKMMMMQRPNDSAIWDQWAVLQLLLPAGVPAGSRAPAWAHARCRRPGQRPPAAAMVASWGAAASALRLIVCLSLIHISEPTRPY